MKLIIKIIYMTKLISSTFLFMFFFSFSSYSQEDTTFVTGHDYVDMDSHGNFDAWAVFPDGNTSYRKILMHYDMRCGSLDNPNWPGCSGWDYTTKISLLKEDGIDVDGNPVFVHDQTLANVITPYGTYMQVTYDQNGDIASSGSNGFNYNWVRRYTYDVTDFASLLQDSVLIRAFYGGWPQPTAPGCFNVTLNFELIEGNPPRNVLNIKNLWSGSKSYSDLQNLNDSTVFISNDELNSILRVTVSGHGLNGEFTEGVNYYIDVNSDNVDVHEMWRDDCGEVALYPQGGTWVYDRANWCPGDKATTIEHELTDFINPGGDNLISFDIFKPNSVSWYSPSDGAGAASYIYDAQLITYEAPNFVLDAVMEDIISPSTKAEHFRFNPSCSSPIVKIKNQGSQILNNVNIVYGFQGYESNTYVWEGNLSFGQSEIVELPPINWNSWEDNTIPFYARVELPNLSQDNYTVNDMLFSNYEIVEEYPNSFAVYFQTNNVPNESSYELRDNQGNLIFSKTGMAANTLYRDTLELDPGCYKFQILDTGGNQNYNEDGLSWWANNDGSGSVKLRAVPGGIFKYYQADFGTEITDYFRVGEYSVNLSNELLEPFIDIFPNPASNTLNIELELLKSSDLNILIIDLNGKVVKSRELVDFYRGSIQLDLHTIESGVYNCVITTEDNRYTKQIVLLR